MSIRSTNVTRNINARKSSVPTIGKGNPLNAQGSEGDLTFRRTSSGLKLYIKANHKWHGVKIGESFDSLEKAIKEIKSKVNTIKQFRLPSTYSVTGNFTLDSSGDIALSADGGNVTMDDGTTTIFDFDVDSTAMTIHDDEDTGDKFSITVAQHGATTVATVDDDASAANLTLDVDGDITLDAGSASGRIYIKKAGDEFARISGKNSLSTLTLYEAGGASSDDYFLIQTDTAGETFIRTVDAAGAAGHLNIEPDGHVEFDGCGVGFDLVTPTYDATDTDVDFRTGNKQFVTFGSGNITDLNLVLPATSGNFVVLLKQDGTGSRTITNYKAGLFGTTPADVKFAGGSNPTLTTDANHVDILSFFWDADNAICYGVATLDFQF